MRRPKHISAKLGFTLVETLVALVLLGVAMLLTLSLIFQEPRTLRRLAAHEEAFLALEATLEAVRAGLRVPPDRQPVDLESLYQPEELIAQDLEIWTERELASSGGLYRVTLTARYRVDRQRFDRTLETLVWMP